MKNGTKEYILGIPRVKKEKQSSKIEKKNTTHAESIY